MNVEDAETTVAEVMDAHRVPGEMDAALARVRERMFASQVVAGHAVGRYVLIDKIGEGGMGSVVRAYDPRLQREVALKRLRSSRNADLRGRLLREARAMAKLHHPNVVTVHDVELIDDELVIAMEYVRGIDLQRWLRETRTPEEILGAFVQAGRGLGAAHAADLVHRDFKPANALVDEAGRVQVTDFGLVRDAREDTPATPSASGATDPTLDGLRVDQTSADIALGTPRYMAPEQESGGAVDRRADIYAFCVALWEALAGAPPFHQKTLSELRFAKLAASPRWPKTVPVRPEILRALERGLKPSPSARWPTMAALLSAIESQPKMNRRWWLTLPIAAAVTVSAVAAVAASRSSSSHMGSDDEGLSWTEERPLVAQRLADLDGAFAEDVATRALAKLDGFVDGWNSQRAVACGADRDHEERELELACLQIGRARLESVVEVLTTISSTEVLNTHRLLSRLPDLSSCSNRDSSLALESRDSPEVGVIRRMLATASDLGAIGRHAEALTEVEAAVNAAHSAGLEALWLESRIQVGGIYMRQQRIEEAIELLREALSVALQRGEDRLVARAASLLGSLLAARGSRAGEGVTLTQLALDMSARTQDSASWTAAIHTNASIALSTAGHPDKAVDVGLQAVRLSLEGGRENTLQHAELLHFSAVSLCQAGRHDEGLDSVNDAVARTREQLGDLHPSLGGPLVTRGSCRMNVDDVEGGIADYREALALFEAAYGPDDSRVGVALDNLGLTLAQNGDPFEAERLMRRSLAIKTQLYDEHHLQITYAQEGLAYALRYQGRFREAEALFEASARTKIANIGRETVPVLHSHIGLAIVAIDLGRVERAVELLDEADRIADATVEPDSELRARIDELRSQLY